MYHPMIIPLLITPHLSIPAGIMYLIYLDNKETIACVRCAQEQSRLRRKENSKLAKFIRENPPNDRQMLKLKLKPVNLKVLIDDGSSFNVNSPMTAFVKSNKFDLIYKSMCCKTRKYIPVTPMSYLVKDPMFQMELKDAVYYKDLGQQCKQHYTCNVVSKIANQHGMVTSKLAGFIRESVWYPIIAEILRNSRREEAQESPMSNLARAVDFKDYIYDQAMFRDADYYFMENSPMHLLAVNEQQNINYMARRLKIKSSPMHQFAKDKNNSLMIMYLSSGITFRKARMTSSPIHIWTRFNKHHLKYASWEMFEIGQQRKQVLHTIKQLLNKNYGRMYRKFMLREFRKSHGIPEVEFKPGCSNYAIIQFPRDVQIVNRFLADSNLDGFTNHTIYYDRNHYQSFATSILVPYSGKPSINDITDAAQTFKNISSLTECETVVNVLSDSSKIIISETEPNAEHHTDIYFVKRDRKTFTSSELRNCSNKIYGFLKRYPNINCKIGCSERWLSDTMVVTLTSSENKDINYSNLNTDLIQVVNLIKGIIFQKVADRISWLHL